MTAVLHQVDDEFGTAALWFSPHCLSGQMPTLFGTAA